MDNVNTLLVWGLGRENVAFLEFLTRIGWAGQLYLYDDSKSAGIETDPRSKFTPIQIVGHEIDKVLGEIDLLVRAPGVSPYKPIIQQYINNGGKTTTSTGIALEILNTAGPTTIGVTGSNGKSSTVTMLASILENAGHRVALVGNIGVPLINLVAIDEELPEYVVVELSSYQIFDCPVSPHYLIFLNLFSDHVDWHLTENNYQNDKLSILSRPMLELAFVNSSIVDRLQLGKAKYTEIRNVLAPANQSDSDAMSVPKIALEGSYIAGSKHLLSNASAAAELAMHLGVSTSSIQQTLKEFKPLAHRQDPIAEFAGITFVDDSISTTPESVLAALDSFKERRVHLILGGLDRHLEYQPLLDALPTYNIASLLFIGPVGLRLREEYLDAQGLEITVEYSKHQTNLIGILDGVELISGDVVLLSPGAPSFDAYKNFEDRGHFFDIEVQNLQKRMR